MNSEKNSVQTKIRHIIYIYIYTLQSNFANSKNNTDLTAILYKIVKHAYFKISI